MTRQRKNPSKKNERRKEGIGAAFQKVMYPPKIMDGLEAIIKVIYKLCLHLPSALFHCGFHWHVRSRKETPNVGLIKQFMLDEMYL